MEFVGVNWIATLTNYGLFESHKQYLVSVGLAQLSRSTSELQKSALAILTEQLDLELGMDQDKLIKKIQEKQTRIQYEFAHKASVAFAIIVLWADARQKSINIIKKEISDRKIALFNLKWTWQQACLGCPDESGIDVLRTEAPARRSIVTKVKKLTTPDLFQDKDFDIALCWLSAATINVTTLSNTAELKSFHQIHSGRTSSKVKDSNVIADMLDTNSSTTLAECSEEDLPDGSTNSLNIDSDNFAINDGAYLQVKSEVDYSEELIKFTEPNKDVDVEKQITPLKALLSSISHEVDRLVAEQHSSLIEKSQEFHKLVTSGELIEMRHKLRGLSDSIEGLWKDVESLKVRCNEIYSMLGKEIDSHPELPDIYFDMMTFDLVNLESLQKLVRDLQSEWQKIEEYDSKRKDRLFSLSEARSRLLEMEDACLEWLGGEAGDLLGNAPAVQEVTDSAFLAEIELATKSIAGRQQYLDLHINRARDSVLQDIEKLLNEVQAQNISDETLVAERYSFGELNVPLLATFSPNVLFLIKDSLAKLSAELQLCAQTTSTNRLAASLTQLWDEAQWSELLFALAMEGRNLELLLVMFAGTHKGTVNSDLKLVHELVEGIESGILQVAGRQGVLDFWSKLLPVLLSRWKPSDVMAKMKLSIAALSAYFLTGSKFPVGLGWEIGDDWPVSDMPTWKALWQSFLLEIPINFSDNSTLAEIEVELDEVGKQLKNVFAQENGQYIRARQLKHNRIAKVLGQKFMPELESYVGKFAELELSVRTAPKEQYGAILSRIQSFCAEISTFDESNLDAQFDVMLSDSQVWEPEGFHRRTLTNVFALISQSLTRYAEVFKKYAIERLRDSAAFTPSKLHDELKNYFTVTSLEHEFIEWLTNDSASFLQKSSDDLSAELLMEQACLSQPTFFLRCPRTASSLISESITSSTDFWSPLLRLLLEDLANPLTSVEGSVSQLIAKVATKQVLMLEGQISNSQYEEAVRANEQLEKKTNQLHKELIELGGAFPAFVMHRDHGRWDLIDREIKRKIAQIRTEREKSDKEKELKLQNLNRQLSDLDGRIFAVRHMISSEGNDLLSDAIEKARRTIRSIDGVQNGVLETIEAFCREVSYQYEHASWALAKIQDIAARLNKGFLPKTQSDSLARTTTQILDLFVRNELVALGLPAKSFESSKKNTREIILTNFLGLKDVKSIEYGALEKFQIDRILSLFHNFSRMVALKPVRDKGKDIVINREDLLWGVYELQNPKTSFLENHCILTILPGSPPKPSTIDYLETVIDEKELLEDRFMVVFAPGCTPQIKNRLETKYPNLGLVIIDDAVMSELVLAEADSRRPVGYLRSLMLNARGATEVDIFTVNQLVIPRSAIFVGREKWIDKLIKSGENFALYGGRRIGKSSILKVVEEKLKEQENVLTRLSSCEGNGDYQDHSFARILARELKLHREVSSVEDFTACIEEYLEEHSNRKIVLLLDEIDKYINYHGMKDRHLLIEAFRKLSDNHGDRFRVVLSGFVDLNACLRGRGPYTPSSDPWRRMIKDEGPLGNLEANQAEEIVNEGFREILGWKYASAVIPQLIVEYTGGHPAFVQHFCDKLQKRIAKRGDKTIRVEDLKAVFDDSSELSFISYVRETLDLNLNSTARFLILSIVSNEKETRTFTRKQVEEYALLINDVNVELTDEWIDTSIERLKVTSVIREIGRNVFEFTVPDYPSILNRLGEIDQLDELVKKVREELRKGNGKREMDNRTNQSQTG